MKSGLVFANFGERSDPHLLADLASLAEEAGWDGVFLPDAIQMVGTEALGASDPWIDLAAIALRTRRVRIGLIVSTPARYRPWQLARQATTLDHLSHGRMVLGVRLGDEYDRGFERFHEEPNLRRRAELLDEGLAIVDGLWSGEPFQFAGEHYQVEEITLLPPPVQRPRIPVWVGWKWPNRRPLQRVVRWDGAVPFAMDGDEYVDLEPEALGQDVEDLGRLRAVDEPFDVVAYGSLLGARHDPAALADLQRLAEAGATWVIEFVGPEYEASSLREAIAQGPPSLA